MADNPIVKQINKYIETKDPTRLAIILSSNKMKATKGNLAALAMLVDDYSEDKELTPINLFLNISPNSIPIDLTQRPVNQDDFIIWVKQQLGDPKDSNSLGNRVLDGKVTHFNLRSWHSPITLFKKFAALAGRECCELDAYPRNIANGSIPLWEACILGTHEIKRENFTKVNSPN